MESLLSLISLLIVGMSVLFVILRCNHPQQRQIRNVVKIEKRYRSLMAASSFNEKEIWKKIAEDHFTSAGWKGEQLAEALKVVETAWLDYHARQDIIKSGRSGAVELARRILAFQHGKGKDLSLAETEKIYGG